MSVHCQEIPQSNNQKGLPENITFDITSNIKEVNLDKNTMEKLFSNIVICCLMGRLIAHQKESWSGQP